jgi:hypothetical protein
VCMCVRGVWREEFGGFSSDMINRGLSPASDFHLVRSTMVHFLLVRY